MEVVAVVELEDSLTFRLDTSLINSLTNSLWWSIRSYKIPANFAPIAAIGSKEAIISIS